MEGRWADAIAINNEIIERFPREVEAYNRKGRALLEQRRYQEALEAYEAALKVDPANLIARRNLGRLDLLLQEEARGNTALESSNDDEQPLPNTKVFIEEVGKTWHGELVNPTDLRELAKIDPGEQLQLEVDGPRLYVNNRHGQRLGEIEAMIAQRVVELMGVGNRYEIYALGLTAHSLRIILREVVRAESLGTRASFPGKIQAVRHLDREGNLLRRDEDLYIDEEEELDEEDEVTPDVSDDIDSADPDEAPLTLTGFDMDEDDLNG